MIDRILRALFRFCHEQLRHRHYNLPGWNSCQNELVYSLEQELYTMERPAEARKYYDQLRFSMFGAESSYDRRELSRLENAVRQAERQEEARKPRIFSATCE